MDIKDVRAFVKKVGGRQGDIVTFEGVKFTVKLPGIEHENEYNAKLGVESVELEQEDPKKTLGGVGKIPEGKRIPDSAKRLKTKSTLRVKVGAHRIARAYLVSVCVFDESGEHLVFEDVSLEELLTWPDHEGSMLRVFHDAIQRYKEETEAKAKNSQAIRNSSISAGSQNGEDASPPKLESLGQTTSTPV